jgi:hypothetical protein
MWNPAMCGTSLRGESLQGRVQARGTSSIAQNTYAFSALYALQGKMPSLFQGVPAWKLARALLTTLT